MNVKMMALKKQKNPILKKHDDVSSDFMNEPEEVDM